MKLKFFSKDGRKAFLKSKLIPITFIVMGMSLIIYTVMAIYFKPNYEIRTDYIGALNTIKNEQGLVDSDASLIKKPDIEFVAYEEGALIGSLIIPSLNYELPIYEGTSKSELEKGVGRVITSALPGEIDNCVLSGHRDTVFSKLGDLIVGEQIIVNSDLGIFVYEVTETRIVEADDQTVIVPTDEATLTLTTCYPFVYLGFAPQRYIISAEIVK